MKRIFSDKQKTRRHAGFTTVELMIAVAAVVVLVGISAIGISSLKKNQTQKSLDNKAQLIYTAAQNRLSQLEAAGLDNIYKGTGIQSFTEGTGESARTLYYVVKGASAENEKAEAFLPVGYLDQEIWKNQWVIEYDADSAAIYAVYYCEEDADMEYSAASRASLAAEATEKTGRIGYFLAGDAESVSLKTDTLHPYIQIENGKVLKATIRCPEPEDSSVGVMYKIAVYNEDGKATTFETVTPEHDNIEHSYTYELILDAITDDPTDRFGNNSRYLHCTPGKDIVIRVEAVPTGDDKNTVDSYTISAVTNSLFANVTTDENGKLTAEVTAGRHLQNLDSETVRTEISYVKQTCDIDWNAAYPTTPFIPIENTDIETYSGTISATQSAVIYNLNVDVTDLDEASGGGLFDSFCGTAIDSLRLCGTEIKSGEKPAGALIGTYTGSGSLEITDCRIYLDEDELEAKNITYQNILIDGKQSGGFIGSNVSGNITFSNCFASTVVGSASATAAGGFIGENVAGEVSIEESYADCYLSGQNAAGFVGSGDVKDITASYTAGYVTSSQNGAGMANGTVNRISNAYTIICFTEDSQGTTYAVAEACTSVDALFYWADGSDSAVLGTKITADNQSNLISQLNSSFHSVSDAYSVSYNLMGNVIGEYTFPIVHKMPHYGDWELSENDDTEKLLKWEYAEHTVDLLKMDGNTLEVGLNYNTETPTIASSDESIAVEASNTGNNTPSIQNVTDNTPEATGTDAEWHTITFDILDKGTTTITATAAADNLTDSFILHVTADLTASTDTETLTVYKGQSDVIGLYAKSSEASDAVDYSSREDLSWTFTHSDGTKAEISKVGNQYWVKGLTKGSETITATATITKNGKTYSADPITIEIIVKEYKAAWATETLNVDILKNSTVSVRLNCSTETPTIQVKNTGVATVATIGGLQNIGSDGLDTDDTHRVITFNLQDKGSTDITATMGTASDTLHLNVTADIIASCNQKTVTLLKGGQSAITFSAKASDGTDYSSRSDLSWSFTYSNDTNQRAKLVKDTNGSYIVKGLANGTETITAKATITKNGHQYSSNEVTVTVKVKEYKAVWTKSDWQTNEDKTLTVDILKMSGSTIDVRLVCSDETPTIDGFDTNVVSVREISALQGSNPADGSSIDTYRNVQFTIGEAGSTDIRATVGEANDTFHLTVTADLVADANPKAFTVFENQSKDITLSAKASDGTDYSSREDLSWTFTHSDGTKAEIIKNGDQYSVKGLAKGSETITAKALITKNGHTYYSDNSVSIPITVQSIAVAYNGTGYTKPSNLTATYGTDYTATVVLDEGQKYSAIEVKVGAKTLELNSDYTFEGSGTTYTLKVPADCVTDDMDVTITVVPETYTVTYYGDGYTKPTNLTVEYGKDYTATITLDSGKSLAGVPAVYVGSQIVELAATLEDGYTWSGSDPYTLTISGKFITDNVEIYIYIEGTTDSSRVSVSYGNKTLVSYYTDNSAKGESSVFSGANRYATKGKDYVAYITRGTYKCNSVTVKCGSKTLTAGVDYTYETADSNILTRHKLVIYGASITGDITVTPSRS